MDPASTVPQIITAAATSVVAVGVLTQAIVWGVRRWRRRVSWRSLNQYERDVVWGIMAGGVSTFHVDYDRSYTAPDKSIAFLRDGCLINNETLNGSVMYLFPTYVIHLESMQDKDLVRPYSKVLLNLQPESYTARPKLLNFAESSRKKVEEHTAGVWDRVNLAD